MKTLLTMSIRVRECSWNMTFPKSIESIEIKMKAFYTIVDLGVLVYRVRGQQAHLVRLFSFKACEDLLKVNGYQGETLQGLILGG